MRRKDFGAAFEEVSEAAREQASLSDAPDEEPAAVAVPEGAVRGRNGQGRPATEPREDTVTARFDARRRNGSLKTLTVHGISIQVAEGEEGTPVQTTVRMTKALREAIRRVTIELDCTFEEFVRDAVAMALERYSGSG